ncbi:MAG: DUF4469 domain-containing protein [Treponema sp.]|jgi:hypothetical protein|nr:DUF4469 domain-containing protein [Treponema sp.]
MSVIDDDVLKVHNTDVMLYESHLEGHKGKLFARTVNDKVLTDDDVCVSAKERGGYTGSLDDLKEHVTIFLREMAHLLRDGYGVNIGGILEARLNVGGWFAGEFAPADKDLNKVTVRVMTLPGARRLCEGVHVVNKGMAPVQSYITDIIDAETGLVNEVLSKDGIFTLNGNRIKIAGEDSRAGVFFILPGTPDQEIGVTAKLAVNEPSKLVGKAPELSPDKDWYVEVRTYFSGNSAKPLKELRTIRSKFTVRQA